jgi:enamine deaminase RidA (YjgF/YER057c/UK114 family)
MGIALAPQSRGSFAQQAREVLAGLREALSRPAHPVNVLTQTVFLRDAADEAELSPLLEEFYGDAVPATAFVLQPPCCGAALAMEVWAAGGENVKIERPGPHTTTLVYDSVRWVYCAGIRPEPRLKSAYEQTADCLARMRAALAAGGARLEHLVRTWFYLGGIVSDDDDGSQRYKELNRARADAYQDVQFCCSLLDPKAPRGVYPASTGIGMQGKGLVAGCLSLETRRDDVFLFPLENPQQTPAYAYHPRYSPRSPKFSRAVALVLGDYVTTWISGTASIVNSESCHTGDLERQTRQTIDNIERLIAPENFTLHNVPGGGATLRDLARARVYVKRPEDFAACKKICEERFGGVPTIYAVADICRPELLVEIEAVAFSPYNLSRK